MPFLPVGVACGGSSGNLQQCNCHETGDDKRKAGQEQAITKLIHHGFFL
jgi:hypothetical protein